MGLIKNTTTIATICFFDDSKAKRLEKSIANLKAAMEAARLPNCIHGPINGYNGYVTYFFGPDGSKEGWEASNGCDKYRKKFKSIVSKMPYLDMAEIQLGGDEEVTKIIDTTDGKRYSCYGLEDF
jgi:hypothetical protein